MQVFLTRLTIPAQHIGKKYYKIKTITILVYSAQT